MNEQIFNYYFEYVILIVLILLGFKYISRSIFGNSRGLGIGKFIIDTVSAIFRFVFEVIGSILSFLIEIFLSLMEGIFGGVLFLFRRDKNIYGSARYLNRGERRRLFRKKKSRFGNRW